GDELDRVDRGGARLEGRLGALGVVATGQVALAHPPVDVLGGAATAARLDLGAVGRGGPVRRGGPVGRALVVVQQREVRAHAGDELAARQPTVAGREG